MSDVVIWHNPRCRKSREGLQFLRDRGVEPTIYEYLKDPPDEDALRALLGRLGIAPRELLRTKEGEYRALGLKDPAKSDDELVAAMAAHPKLIERPVVVKGERAVVGRPADAIAAIL